MLKTLDLGVWSLYIFYASTLVFALRFPKYIVYLFVLFLPFYEIMPMLYINLSFLGISFTLKPFLFAELILICFCFRDLCLRRNTSSWLSLDEKISMISFLIFCMLAFVFGVLNKSQYLTELNMAINIIFICALSYFYANKKIDIDNNEDIFDPISYPEIHE